MASPLTINVTGTPAPQGSKRHVGRGIMVESSKRVKPWRQDVRAAALEAMAAQDWTMPTGAVSVGLVFYLARPLGHYGTGRNADQLRPSAPSFPAARPDVDKLARSTLDALTEAGVIRDDSRIVTLTARKRYSRDGSTGAVVTVAPVV